MYSTPNACAAYLLELHVRQMKTLGENRPKVWM